MKNIQSPQSQAGINMVEIMIALLIGVFLIGGLIQMFISSKKTYEMQDASSRLQENGRFAVEFLSMDVHEADFWGCMSDRRDSIFPVGVGLVQGLSGIDNDALADPNVINGTDSITLSGFKYTVIPVVADNGISGPLTIAVGTGGNLNVGDWAMVSNCNQGDVFQIAAILAGGTNITSASTFSAPYGTNSQIFKWYSVTYDIRTGANGQPALYRTEFDINATQISRQELVEGIENMQILYGEDVDADGLPNYYVPVNQVTDMNNVKGVRVSFLASSVADNLTSKPISYTYDGQTIRPKDTRIRRVYDITLAIRSRLK
jgi:type IV pilus assembly protein PilW